MAISRRNFLQVLSGAPLAFAMGETLLAEAVSLEERAGSPIVIASNKIQVYKPNPNPHIMPLMQYRMSEGQVLRWVAAPLNEIVVNEEDEIWVKLSQGPSKIIAIEIHRIRGNNDVEMQTWNESL